MTKEKPDSDDRHRQTTPSEDPGDQALLLNRSISDLMIPLDAYPHIDENTTLAEAISTITQSQIERRGKLSLPRVVLVIGADDQLLGLLRRRDILRGLLPSFFKPGEKARTYRHFDRDLGIDLELADLFKSDGRGILSRNAQRSVTQVMQPFEDSIDINADTMELIRKMVVNQFHFLPVTSHGQVLGVVRTVEVLNHVRRILDEA